MTTYIKKKKKRKKEKEKHCQMCLKDPV
jgi:hypothetical protein